MIVYMHIGTIGVWPKPTWRPPNRGGGWSLEAEAICQSSPDRVRIGINLLEISSKGVIND